MDDSQLTKSRMTVLWIQMTMLMLAGILLAAAGSYLVADLQWRKSERELDAVKQQAEENARKAGPQVAPEEDGTIIVPLQAAAGISNADRDLIVAADIRNQAWLNRRVVSKWFATRSAGILAALAVVYWFLKR